MYAAPRKVVNSEFLSFCAIFDEFEKIIKIGEIKLKLNSVCNMKD